MDSIARIIIITGIFLIIIGLIWQLGNLIGIKFGNLPGDFSYKTKNTSIYFPLATSILLSIILSIILTLIFKFMK